MGAKDIQRRQVLDGLLYRPVHNAYDQVSAICMPGSGYTVPGLCFCHA